MKRIKLTNITRPDKSNVYIKRRMYAIFLGNDLKMYFTSEREAKKYMADTNRFLNIKLHELNYIFSNLFVEYRKHWFFIGTGRNKIETLIENEIDNITRGLNMSVTGCQRTNGNYLTFKHLYSSIKGIVNITMSLREMLFEKRYYNDIHKLSMIRLHAERIKNDLDNYGKDEKLSIQFENDLEFFE